MTVAGVVTLGGVTTGLGATVGGLKGAATTGFGATATGLGAGCTVGGLLATTTGFVGGGVGIFCLLTVVGKICPLPCGEISLTGCRRVGVDVTVVCGAPRL